MESKTVWGILILLLTGVAQMLGVEVLDTELTDLATGVGLIVGTGLGIWGRATATRPITGIGNRDTEGSEGGRLNVILVGLCVLGVSVASLSQVGCQHVDTALEKPAVREGLKLGALVLADIALAQLGDRVKEVEPYAHAMRLRLAMSAPPLSGAEATDPDAVAALIWQAAREVTGDEGLQAVLVQAVRDELLVAGATESQSDTEAVGQAYRLAGQEQVRYNRAVAAGL